MKTTILGVLLVAVLVFFAALRFGTGKPVQAATTSSTIARAATAPTARSRSRFGTAVLTSPGAAPSPAAAGDRVARLPASHEDVPLTPELDRAYQELHKFWGPGFLTWLDSKLARRAAIAKCGIGERGAAKILIHSAADLEHKTQTIEDVEMVTSFEGEMGDVVSDCIRKAVIGVTEKHVTETPDWFSAEARESFATSVEDHEYDTIGFPIEEDELYQLFKGETSAYQELKTKERYGWK